MAEASDGSEEILRAIEAMKCTEQRKPDIKLPRFSEKRIREVAKRFREASGVGKDW